MGQAQSFCGQNIFDKILHQYGDNALKFILAQKSKIVIQDKFAQITRRILQSFQSFESAVEEQTESNSSHLKKIFDQIKEKTNSIIPGGVATVQRLKGQSINNFSGYSNAQNSIQNIKKQALQNLNNKKQQMMDKLSQKKQSMIHQINAQKPNIPLYEGLPQSVKRSFMNQAQKKFKKQIIENQQSKSQIVKQIYNPTALNKMFLQMSPEKVLRDVVQGSAGQIQKRIMSQIGGGSLINRIF